MKSQTNPFHLTLLAKNQAGYTALTELISKAYQEGQRQEQDIPMLKKEWIEENHQGLLALSGAMEGDIGMALVAGNDKLAEQCAVYWSKLFKQSFYLEIQRVNKVDEEQYIKAAVELAVKLDLPVVATNDVRFIDKEDFDSHESARVHQPRKGVR